MINMNKQNQPNNSINNKILKNNRNINKSKMEPMMLINIIAGRKSIIVI